MQNLKDRFNEQARRKRREAQRKRDLDLDFFVLWLWSLLMLIEQQRRLDYMLNCHKPSFTFG